MTILEMIKEWRKGCSCGLQNPADCSDCTTALIDAVERKLIKPVPGKEFDISKYEFRCTRVINDTSPGDESVVIYTPCNTGFIAKQDAIALAKHFKLTNKDLS